MKRLHFFLIVIYFLSSGYNNCYGQVSASFDVSRTKICSGSTVTFTNTSTSASQFNWYIDGLHYSTAMDTQAVFTDPCYSTYQIKLIACDSSGNCDTATTYVEVFDSCFFHLTGDIIHCIGDTIRLSQHPEAISVQWVVNPPQPYLSGCDTCSTISFILAQNGVMVDKHNTYDGGCSDITSFHYLCTINSIDEHENSIKIFPNPVRDFLQISAEDNQLGKIMLYDIAGREYQLRALSNRIDFRNYPDGIYFLKIIFKNKKESKFYKIIVDK